MTGRRGVAFQEKHHKPEGGRRERGRKERETMKEGCKEIGSPLEQSSQSDQG